MTDQHWTRHGETLPNIRFQTLNTPIYSFILHDSRADMNVNAPISAARSGARSSRPTSFGRRDGLIAFRRTHAGSG